MQIKPSAKAPSSATDLERRYIPHLRTQFQHAQPILFTGAGFSIAATNSVGEKLPAYPAIQEKLWDLCFPNEAFEDESTLPDLYEHALKHHPKTLSSLLTQLLSVDTTSLPHWYAQIFSFPWFRCYTLNVDDLPDAVERAFDLPRRLRGISATNPQNSTADNVVSDILEVVHLNGTLPDLPEHVTFSVTQYADRISKADPWYTRFVVDLLSHPVVIIGTRLDEPPLWRHLEYRGSRGNRRLGELRPRSYLVTPHLARARRTLLAELNITWLPMTAEEFMTAVLSELTDAKEQGLAHLRARTDGTIHSAAVPDVADLAINPTEETEFLLGHEPIWADLQSGRAIHRDSDDQLWAGIRTALEEESPSLVVVTGTAGSGKTTSLMGACLKLTAQGHRVGWIDRDSNLSPHDIRRVITAHEGASILAIDDADVYGPSLAANIRDLLNAKNKLLILVALRSTKVDRALNPSLLDGVVRQDYSMPPLTDTDIDALLSVLDKHNRLGALKGKTLPERREILSRQCGRQLLVAMIEATSGRRFEEKVLQELTDLEGEGAKIYALIAVAHAFRFTLQRDEILLALGDASNETLNIVQRLINRHIISCYRKGEIQTRHRVIAEVLHNELQRQGLVAPAIGGLAFMAASKVRSDMRRSARPWRMLRHFINHDYLLRSTDMDQTRNIYGALETILDWDFHYWLQRGSLEVEEGDLKLARLFLNHAHSIAPDDHFVENEWAYLLFREAIENPRGAEAQASVDEATSILEDLIDRRRRLDSYPYHVLGSQGLSWSRRGIKNSKRKAEYLEKLLRIVAAGMRRHPTERQLKKLHEDIKREYLGIAVSRR